MSVCLMGSMWHPVTILGPLARASEFTCNGMPRDPAPDCVGKSQGSFTADQLIELIPNQNMCVAVIVLKLFLALLPKLLAFMNSKQGISSRSGNDFGVVKKYFIFQVSIGQSHYPSLVAMKQCSIAVVTDKGSQRAVGCDCWSMKTCLQICSSPFRVPGDE